MRAHDLEASSSLTHFTYTAVQLPSMRTWGGSSPPRRSSSCWPTLRPNWTRTLRSCRPVSRRASCPRGSAASPPLIRDDTRRPAARVVSDNWVLCAL